MLANADDGSLSTKDKSLPLKRSAIALLLKISLKQNQLYRRSQNNVLALLPAIIIIKAKVVVSTPTFYEVCWYIKSNSYYIH